jgi:hypothetical protein
MGDRVSNRIPEWRLQAEVCAKLNAAIDAGAPFEFAASLEGVRLNRTQALQAKATGMKAGEPDLRLYFEDRRVVFVEMKGEGGRLNADQLQRIPKLHALGFTVHVVKAATCEEAIDLVLSIVRAELTGSCGSSALPTAWWPKA